MQRREERQGFARGSAAARVSVRVALCASACLVAGTAQAVRADAADVDVVATVKTVKSRSEMSAFLVKAAAAAEAKRDWARAIPMYEAIVAARGPGSPEARALANAYALAGQHGEAVNVLTAFANATDDPAAKAQAEDDIKTFEKINDPFSKPLPPVALDREAKQAFDLGRKAFAAKQYGDALVYYTMGYRLAPDLPGFLRELGATYDKLGATDKKIDFYLAYLHRRPFGKNADEARKALGGAKDRLGTLTISSSLPCDQVWVAGQPLPGKLPKKDLAVAPGQYKALCFSGKYELGFFAYATVTAGQTAQLQFNWAIVVNELKDPYGRISIEEPRSKGVMLDLGIDQPEIGVVVPDDGHPMRMVLKDDTGAKTEERFVKIAPGQRVVVKW